MTRSVKSRFSTTPWGLRQYVNRLFARIHQRIVYHRALFIDSKLSCLITPKMGILPHPTPCPPPRLGIRRPDQSAMYNYSVSPSSTIPDYTGCFRNIKLRSRRTMLPSVGWDPIVDIYDDNAFQEPQTVAKVVQKPFATSQQNPAVSQELGRRSVLWAQPAQRLPLGTKHGWKQNSANTKKRRTPPVAAHLTQKELDAAAGQRTLDYIPIKQSDIKKAARRRTIYVPSEDTTILTIHPGASLRYANPRPTRSRRSEIFCDLSLLSDEDGDQANEPKSVVRASWKSPAVASGRTPLQQSSRPFQSHVLAMDVLGSGGGKENIPPGKALLKSKKSYSGTPSAVRSNENYNAISRSSCSKANSSRRTTIGVGAPVKPLNNNASLGTQKLQSTSACAKISALRNNIHQLRTSETARAKRNVATPQRSKQPELPDSPLRSLRESCTSMVPSKLNVPLVPQCTEWEKYPALNADLSKPELYEDMWLSHQETAITQLVNSHFDSIGHTGGSAFHTSSTMRKSLLNLHQDPSSVLLHKRLEASLRFGALSLPSETLQEAARFTVDLGLRQRFLQLWLKTYNISSLQAAAEVVIGHEIAKSDGTLNSPTPASPQGSAARIRARHRSVEAFLKTFLIRKEDVAPSRSSINGSPHAAGHKGDSFNDFGSPARVWRRTVHRSLMLILLLDRAQSAGKLEGCLFKSSSIYKSSGAVLQTLASVLLPSIGDVSRFLGHLKYHLTHVQYPLQEQAYHINNLATDLRDGVLLTRLMETLLYPPTTIALQGEDVTVSLPTGENLTTTLNIDQGHSWVLSQHLKFPCISRVQKLYNAQIGLSAVAGVKDIGILLADIKAEDIVDGHREKTLYLLWSLVGRWGLGTLLDFTLVEKEVVRLRRAWQDCRHRNRHSAADLDNEEAEPPHLTALERHTHLLKSWSLNVARVHGVQVSNLSTSFANGKAYNAIIAEYTSHHPSTQPPTPSSSSIPSNKAGSRLPPSITGTLKALGCSQAFIALFQNTSTIPSPTTTTALLAFLASRLLPASLPHFSATRIQHAWRHHLARRKFRERLALAVLARDCAVVVGMRERIVWAAVVMQRRWREVHRFQLGI